MTPKAKMKRTGVLKLRKQIAKSIANIYIEHGEVDDEAKEIKLEPEVWEEAAFLHDSYITSQMMKLEAAVIKELEAEGSPLAEWIKNTREESTGEYS
jgi:hypothetical protein